MVRTETNPVDTVILQIYMPTTEYEEEEIDEILQMVNEKENL